MLKKTSDHILLFKSFLVALLICLSLQQNDILSDEPQVFTRSSQLTQKNRQKLNAYHMRQDIHKGISTEMLKNLRFRQADEECTDEQAASCAVFIASIIKACTAAMETEGADIIADIRCARARKLITDKKYCLPCLCEKIKEKGWKWVECPEVHYD